MRVLRSSWSLFLWTSTTQSCMWWEPRSGNRICDQVLRDHPTSYFPHPFLPLSDYTNHSTFINIWSLFLEWLLLGEMFWSHGGGLPQLLPPSLHPRGKPCTDPGDVRWRFVWQGPPQRSVCFWCAWVLRPSSNFLSIWFEVNSPKRSFAFKSHCCFSGSVYPEYAAGLPDSWGLWDWHHPIPQALQLPKHRQQPPVGEPDWRKCLWVHGARWLTSHALT